MGTDELAMGWIQGRDRPRRRSAARDRRHSARRDRRDRLRPRRGDRCRVPPRSASTSRARAWRSRASARSASTPRAFSPTKGAVLVAASDSHGTIADDRRPRRRGADRAQGEAAAAYGTIRKGRSRAIATLSSMSPATSGFPAARPDVIHAGNVARLKTQAGRPGRQHPVHRGGGGGARRPRRARPARFHRQCRRRDLRRRRISRRHRNAAPSPRSRRKSVATPRSSSTKRWALAHCRGRLRWTLRQPASNRRCARGAGTTFPSACQSPAPPWRQNLRISAL